MAQIHFTLNGPFCFSSHWCLSTSLLGSLRLPAQYRLAPDLSTPRRGSRPLGCLTSTLLLEGQKLGWICLLEKIVTEIVHSEVPQNISWLSDMSCNLIFSQITCAKVLKIYSKVQIWLWYLLFVRFVNLAPSSLRNGVYLTTGHGWIIKNQEESWNIRPVVTAGAWLQVETGLFGDVPG